MMTMYQSGQVIWNRTCCRHILRIHCGHLGHSCVISSQITYVVAQCYVRNILAPRFAYAMDHGMNHAKAFTLQLCTKRINYADKFHLQGHVQVQRRVTPIELLKQPLTNKSRES